MLGAGAGVRRGWREVSGPDARVGLMLRWVCAEGAGSLTASSQGVATHFATVAAANGYVMDRA